MTDLPQLQKRILLAAYAEPDEPIHCNQMLGGRWSVRAGGETFTNGSEVEEAFTTLVGLGLFEFDVDSYRLTGEGRHLAANLAQGEE